MSKTFDDFRGTISENLAINEFLRKGCEVHKNVRQHGCVDIIVIHPNGKVELLDIKTRCIRKRDSSPIHRSLTEKQKRWGVKLYYIDENNQGHYHPPKGKNEK
jgi:hypothetical protein|tara:strand:+ start:912 stop:1220 length:309 start_codon:yes stop_codon:yes gene_type:complete